MEQLGEIQVSILRNPCKKSEKSNLEKSLQQLKQIKFEKIQKEQWRTESRSERTR